MKLKILSMIALLVLPVSVAMAQGKVEAPNPSGLTSLDLYEQPGAAKPLRQISVSEIGLPLAILAIESNYYKVTIAGHEYWLRGAQVRRSRKSTAGCVTTTVAPAGATALTAATPGAGKDACQ